MDDNPLDACTFSAFFLELHSVYLIVSTPVLSIKVRTTCPLLGEVIFKYLYDLAKKYKRKIKV